MSLNDQSEKREMGMAIPLLRVVQAIIIVLGVAGVSALMPIATPLRVLFFCVMVALSLRVGHPFARVVADGRGLYVTRYVKTHFLEWGEVISVQRAWREGGMKVEFCRAIAGLRYAIVPMFDLHMPVSRVFFVRSKREEPEAILWLRERIQAARRGSL